MPYVLVFVVSPVHIDEVCSECYVCMYICVVYTIDGVVGVECCVVNGMQ